MVAEPVVFPGEDLPISILPIPSNPKKSLNLGHGLKHTPPSTVTSTHVGPLGNNPKKNSIWVENHDGRV